VTEVREQYEARLNDERRQHDRDLIARGESGRMENTMTQKAFEMQIAIKDQELQRMAKDLSRAQAELKEEKNKSLADRIDEASSVAEALGYEKGGEGAKDWKSAMGEAAIGFVGQLPSLAANIAQSVRGNQMPQLPPRGIQHVSPAGMHQPAFATDGVDMDLGSQGYRDPIMPGDDPLNSDVIEGYEDFEDEEEEETPQRLPQIVQAPQSVAPPAPPAPATPSGAGSTITDDQIVQFSSLFRDALTQGATPDEVGDKLVKDLSPVMAKAIVQELSITRVFNVLQSAPNGDADPLLRADGQQFLKKIWESVKQKTA
jgi:hypothetical protein